jgi:ATP-dependent Clp protease ATP-binding subunit ClpC
MNRYDDRARLVFHYAREEGNRLGHAMVGPEHLLLGLMREGGTAATILTEFGASLDGLRRRVEEIIGRGEGNRLNDAPSITPRARRVMELASSEARNLGAQVTSTEHILLGIIREGDGVAFRILQELTKDVDTIRWRVLAQGEGGSAGKAAKPVATPFLDEYGRDLTKQAREGKLDPVIGRSEEIRRVTQILTRRTKNNPVLIGDPGVGKTAIVEGLALAIFEKRTPPNLHGVRLVSLDLSGVVAGTKYRGEFEERLRQIIEELRNAKVMAFIDELHTLVGAGGAEGTLDAANILKPALSRGEIQVIGATTTGEYHRYIEKDAALERRFQPVIVLEPSPAETLQILRGLRSRYEEHHGVQIPDQALELAVRIGERSLPGRNFPDKAIDLIDEAASRVRLNMSVGLPVAENEDGEPYVTREDIESVINSMGGIYSEETAAQLSDLEDQLQEQVYGQPDAIRAMSSALRRARVGLGGRTRVAASFLFVGPSGVGKTHLAKALARTLFGSERSLIRVDMSEFQESHSISKLIGSPPGYVGYEQGGRLTEAVRRQPFSVILLDEIEKAHPDVYNTFLQVLDDGRLTDGLGRTVDFRRTILIMTSNTGFNVNPTVGFSPVTQDSNTPLRHIFTPEFLDRLDDVIRFRPLGEEELVRVAQQLMGEMREELASRELNVTFDPAIAAWLVGKLKARSPKHAVGSSRQLRTLVREEIEDPLALELIGSVGEELRVVLGTDGIQFERGTTAPPQILA